MGHSFLSNTCRYFTWLVLIGMVGTGSTILAKDASQTRFPESWVSRVRVPGPWSPPGREPGDSFSVEYGGAGDAHEMTHLKTSEELRAALSLPFQQERKERFTQLLQVAHITEDEWGHFREQLKFRDEVDDFQRLWASQKEELSDLYCAP